MVPRRNPKDTLKAYTVLASPQGLEMMRDLYDTYVKGLRHVAGDVLSTGVNIGKHNLVVDLIRMMSREAQEALSKQIEEDFTSGYRPD